MSAFDTFVVSTGIELGPGKPKDITNPKPTPRVFKQDADYHSYHRKARRLECRVRNLQTLLKRANAEKMARFKATNRGDGQWEL